MFVEFGFISNQRFFLPFMGRVGYCDAGEFVCPLAHIGFKQSIIRGAMDNRTVDELAAIHDYDKQKWFDLYKTALLELNRAAMTGRISDAPWRDSHSSGEAETTPRAAPARIPSHPRRA